VPVAASTEMPLEIERSIRADCALAMNSPLRKTIWNDRPAIVTS